MPATLAPRASTNEDETAQDSMTRWDRSTTWRQGHLLTPECVAAFALNEGIATGVVAAVVISHDCDLAQPSGTEPVVEVIVGRFLDGPPHGNFTHNKNLRRLHIECDGGTAARAFEIEATARRSIPKDSAGGQPGLVDFEPSVAHRMTVRARNVLQHWLAARYRRAAFPDEFDRRLKDETGVAERLAKAFKDTGKHVSAVFFDVDDGMELQRSGPDELYEVRVTLLYATDEDPGATEAAATAASKRVEEIFKSRCTTERAGANVWQWIELQGVEVISDQALTYADSLQLTKWHADHISLRAEPEQPMLDG